MKKPGIRLITLLGSPGIGKARLSIETARRSIQDFEDGVFFVHLAPLDEASLGASTITQSIGYIERGGSSSVEILKKGMADRHILLILDNCEHLIDDVAALVSDLLSACPYLKIFATSRESLRVTGEWLYPVPALEVPQDNASVDIQSMQQFPALALFAERARAVRPEFTLNEKNIQAVASICNQLDGLPLAIELIASRMRLMSPQSLLERMSNQFILSADGLRAVPERQKTLKNATGWSYDFLTSEEQKLFAYLSVFSGGFTLEAAESIFSGISTDRTVTALITSLSDKSLLLRTYGSSGEICFSMLFTIQQFALEHLSQTGDEQQIRDAHLDYFIRYAEHAEKEIRGPRQAEWIEQIETEHNNNRAALEWAISAQKTDAALRLLWALGWPWEVRGHYNEAYGWLKFEACPTFIAIPCSIHRF
jgi:predicted ATPase